MSKPIVITVDSPADFSKVLEKRYGVYVIPLIINLDGESYEDGVDIVPDDIFKAYDEKKILPKTSAVPIASYIDFFSSFTQKGMRVIHICISSRVSSTYQNAVIAASELEDVFVVDSLSLSTGMALLAIRACSMRDEGLEAEAIVKSLLEAREKVKVSFIIDKLDFLYKGGRCSALASFGANILGIKPSIKMANGVLDVGKKYRGKMEQVSMQYIQDVLDIVGNDIDLECAFLVHTGVDESEMENAHKYVMSRLKLKNLHTVQAGCTITTHCGQNCFAFIYMTK